MMLPFDPASAGTVTRKHGSLESGPSLILASKAVRMMHMHAQTLWGAVMQHLRVSMSLT